MPIINGILFGGGGEPTNGLPADLLSGKKLNNEDGDSVVGTMPNNGAVGGTITQQAGKVIIPAGYTSGGQVGANIAGLVAGNIKQGVTVGGVAGTFTADASAAATDILTTKTAYVQGNRVDGTMANQGAITQTISTQGGQYTVPGGYHNGSGKVTASFANLVAGNVKSGVNIGGVVGSLIVKNYATGTASLAPLGNEFKVNSISLGWQPFIIIFHGTLNITYTSSGTTKNVTYYANLGQYLSAGATSENYQVSGTFVNYLTSSGYNGNYYWTVSPLTINSGSISYWAFGL